MFKNISPSIFQSINKKLLYPSKYKLYPLTLTPFLSSYKLQKLYFASLGFKLNDNCIQALDKVRVRYNDIIEKLNKSSSIDKNIEDTLSQKEISSLNKELKNIQPLADEITNYKNKNKELIDLKNIIDDKSSDKVDIYFKVLNIF